MSRPPIEDMKAWMRDTERRIQHQERSHPRMAWRTLRKTSAQTISTGTWTTIFGWSIDTNDQANSPLVYNGGVITVGLAGLYVIEAAISWFFNATGDRGVRILHNGNAEATGLTQANTSVTTQVRVQRVIFLNVNDTVAIQGFQGSGANLNTYVSADARTTWSMGRVAS